MNTVKVDPDPSDFANVDLQSSRAPRFAPRRASGERPIMPSPPLLSISRKP
jgi:hypothetical protein